MLGSFQIAINRRLKLISVNPCQYLKNNYAKSFLAVEKFVYFDGTAAGGYLRATQCLWE